MPTPAFEIEVIFALPEHQLVRRVMINTGCSAAQAIEHAGLLKYWQPETTAPLSIARFGRPITPDTVLLPGDRVEILRPLAADPKEQRRNRARSAARMRRAK